MQPRKIPKSEEEKLSRALSRTLRHIAIQQGIPQDSHGWCLIEDILAKPPYKTMKTTINDIYLAVDSNTKKRYELNNDRTAIRAVQGHTVSVDVQATPVTLPADLPTILVHGTTLKAWEVIRIEGIKTMKRLHIHMASGLPGTNGVISGMRSRSQVYIYLNGEKMLSDGVVILKAVNGVHLTPGVDGVLPPKYFASVTDSDHTPLI